MAERKRAAGDAEALEFLKGVSPVAWRHINLIGSFDFTASNALIDLEALAARFSDPDFWRQSLREGDAEGPE